MPFGRFEACHRYKKYMPVFTSAGIYLSTATTSPSSLG